MTTQIISYKSKEELGAALKRMRLDAGKSQWDACKAIGSVPATISHYENGRREPGVNDIIKLATFYGYNSHFVFENHDED